MTDKVRVLRVIEYVGTRDNVEAQIERSLRDGTHGDFRMGKVVIRVATVGDFPEVLEQPSHSLTPTTLAALNEMD